ncbi:FAD-dependent oxidoreductase [Chitinibacteraceae bacterium HSL-7]
MHDVDVLIIGGGVAGLTARQWLSGLGWRTALVERQNDVGGALADSAYPVKWLPGWGEVTGQAFIARLCAEAGHGAMWCNDAVSRAQYDGTHWQLALQSGATLRARAVIAACGARAYSPYPEHPRLIVGAQLAALQALGAARVAVLGGGDNALEHALWLADQGAQVTVLARAALRGAAALLARVEACRAIHVLTGVGALQPAPDAGGVTVSGQRFDAAAVFFGYRPASSGVAVLDAADPAQQLYVIGDMAAPRFPNVLSAQGEAAVAAKTIDAWLTASGAKTRAG